MAFWQVTIRFVTPLLKPKVIQVRCVPKIRRYSSTCPVGARQKKHNRFTVLSCLSSCVGAPYPAFNHDHRIIDDPYLSSYNVDINQVYLDAMVEGERMAEKLMKKSNKVFDSHSMWMERWRWEENEWIGGPQDVPQLMKWYEDHHSEISKEINKKMLLFVAAYGSDINFLNVLFHRERDNKADEEMCESYVVGLLNCMSYNEAFKAYQEMCSNDMNGSLHMYNKLLSHVCDVGDGDKSWELTQNILNRMETVKTMPNTLTFSYLTHVASKQTEDPLSLWIDLITEMRGKYGLKPSLASYFHLLGILERVPREEWLRYHAPSILKELKDGNIDMQAQHPDDLLFLSQFMAMLKLNSQEEQEVSDPALLETVYNLRANLLCYVIENELGDLTNNSFFLTYFSNFLNFSDPENFSIDYIYEEYKRISEYFSPPDGRVFRFMFQSMLDAKHIHYLPQLVNDLRKSRIFSGFLPDYFRDSILKTLLENGEEVTGNHEQHLQVLQDVYSSTKVTKEIISQCIYCLSVWGEEAQVDLKLEDCENIGHIPRSDVLEGALLLSQYYGREDITGKLLDVSKKHGLEVEVKEVKDKDVLRTEMTISMNMRHACILSSDLGCSNSLDSMKDKTLTGHVVTRTRGKGLDVALGHVGAFANIRRSELPPEGMDYVFSSDVLKGKSFRIGDRFKCSVKDVKKAGERVFLVVASPRYLD